MTPQKRTHQVQSLDPSEIPFSAEAEQAVIGAVMTNPDAYTVLSENLKGDDFFLKRHQWIWEAIGRVVERHEDVDHLVVSKELQDSDQLDEIGGVAYIMRLINQTPSSAHAKTYAGLVWRCARRRDVLTALEESTAQMLDEGQVFDQAMNAVEARIRTVTARALPRSEQTIQEVMSDVFAQVETRMNNRTDFYLPTGLKGFDQFTSGLERGSVHVVGGKPNMGKTSLCIGMAIGAARLGVRTAFISNEIQNERLGLRVAAMETGINLQSLKRGEITELELNRFVEAVGRLSKHPVIMDYIPQTTVNQVHAKVLRWQRERGLDVLFIDGLWRMVAPEFRGDQGQRNEINGYLTDALAQIAKATNVAIVVTHQLTKAIDHRQDKRPTKGDLEYGGKIDMNADLIALIYRDVVYNPATERPAEAEIIIDKNRDGPTGTVYMHFDKKATRFTDATVQPVDLASTPTQQVTQEQRHANANPDV